MNGLHRAFRFVDKINCKFTELHCVTILKLECASKDCFVILLIVRFNVALCGVRFVEF